MCILFLSSSTKPYNSKSFYVSFGIFNSYPSTLIVAEKALRDLIKAVLAEPSETNVDAVIDLASSLHHFLLPAFSTFQESQSVPLHWMALLKDIVCSSPATGYVQGCSKESFSLVIEPILSGENTVADLLKLNSWCPGLHKFLCLSSDDDKRLIRPIIERIKVMIEVIENSVPHLLQTAAPDNDRQGSFPSLPILRTRGHYAMDKQGIRLKVCNKLAIGRKNLLPGIFLMHCTHGEEYVVGGVAGQGPHRFIHL